MVVKSSDVTVAITPCSSWLLVGRTNLSTFAGDPSLVIDSFRCKHGKRIPRSSYLSCLKRRNNFSVSFNITEIIETSCNFFGDWNNAGAH